MNFSTCKKCNRLITKTFRSICDECIQKEEKNYTLVRDYLIDNPGASVYDVCEGTGVDERDIELLIKSGRLERCGVKCAYKCGMCDTLIETGVVCEKCKQAVSKKVGSIKKEVEKNKPPEPVKPPPEVPKSKDSDGRFHRLAKK
ncbi:hypothetical protein HYY75_03795 [bacterium]|nr:hypothetical protein [bacterium]